MSSYRFFSKIGLQIKSFEEDSFQLDEMLNSHSKGNCSEEEILLKFKLLNNKYPANPIILLRLLEFLQLSNDPKIFKTFKIDEIEILLKKLSEIFMDDVEINMEYFYFINNVMDDEKNAIKFLTNFKKRIIKKISL